MSLNNEKLKTENRFLGDYHNHTNASDAFFSTPSSLAKRAIKLGIKEICISDHGFANIFLGVRRCLTKFYLKRIEKAQRKFPEIKVYKGIEADIRGFDGKIDLRPSDFKLFDIIILGFHRWIRTSTIKELFTFQLYNGFLAKHGKNKKIAENTSALIKAIEENPIDILAHINHHFEVDVKSVAETCAKVGTYVEINIKHLAELEEFIDVLLKTECLFIVDSDSHFPGQAGNLQKGFDFIIKHNIPRERIANLDKRPEFRSQKEKYGKE